MSDLKDAALDYAARGFRPIPCEPRGKKPLVRWKEHQHVQPTPEQISRWWDDHPDANVALVLGDDVFALDVDGPDGHAALRAGGVVLDSRVPTSLTGRGVHYFFRGQQPDRVAVLPHVDVRGRGIVVVPPSVHANGKRYTWLQGLETIGEAPFALLSLLAKPPATQMAPDGGSWLTEALVGVGEGRRDATCTRLAGYFLGKGMPPDAVRQLLYGWAERCMPPFPKGLVTKCVESIATKEGGHSDGIAAPETVGSFVPSALDSFTRPNDRKLSTSLSWLDGILDGGVESSDYILLGARPGIGKTALALQIGRHVAHAGNGVLIVSREMGQKALTRRLICQESQVPLHVLKRGEMTPEQQDQITAAGQRLSRLPLWISVARTIESLVETVASYEPGALRLVILDYLQLVRRADGGGDTRHTIDYISQELRAVANRYCPVLCLSALSRPPRDVASYEPDMSSLKESSGLEHDGDVILLMTREPGAEVCQLKIAKNRDGRVGSHWFRFRGDILTFDENLGGA